MIRRCSRTTEIVCCVIAMLIGCLHGTPLCAQQAKSNKKPSKTPPFVVVCVASFERLMDDADYLFEAAGRPELTEVIGGVLASARDLKGLNRDSSAGLLLFLDGLLPEPVGFVPVRDIDEMLKTITVGPVTTNKKDEGLYEILGGSTTLFAKVVGDYVFVGRSEAALNRDFSNPAQYTRRLAASYDVSASLNLRAIPKATRDLLLSLLRAGAEIQLQQRDKEPPAAYRIRKAAGVSSLESLEMFLTQTEEATIGFNISSEQRVAFGEIVVTADPKSDYAKLLNELGTARSLFASELNHPGSMTVSASLKVNKSGRDFLKEWVAVTHGIVVRDLKKPTSASDPEFNPFEELIQCANATISEGQLDFFMQLRGTPPGPLTLVGAVRIAEADRFGLAVNEIIDRTGKKSDVKSVEKRFAEHRGVIIHRLQFKNLPESAHRVFGKDYGFYGGSGNGAVWFSVGAEEGLPSLKKVIDNVIDAPAKDNPVPPAQFVLHAASLLGFAEPSEGFANELVELMRDSFAQGGGTIRAELLPIANGMQARLTFDEGYIKLVGKSIAARIDHQK